MILYTLLKIWIFRKNIKCLGWCWYTCTKWSSSNALVTTDKRSIFWWNEEVTVWCKCILTKNTCHYFKPDLTCAPGTKSIRNAAHGNHYHHTTLWSQETIYGIMIHQNPWQEQKRNLGRWRGREGQGESTLVQFLLCVHNLGQPQVFPINTTVFAIHQTNVIKVAVL